MEGNVIFANGGELLHLAPANERRNDPPHADGLSQPQVEDICNRTRNGELEVHHTLLPLDKGVWDVWSTMSLTHILFRMGYRAMD